MKNKEKQERKHQKALENRIHKWTELAKRIEKDGLFLYRFVKKSKMSVKNAIEFLNTIQITVTNEMIHQRKVKCKEIKLQKKNHKDKIKLKNEININDVRDLSWLYNDYSEESVQKELEWLDSLSKSKSSVQINTHIINEDDLPF